MWRIQPSQNTHGTHHHRLLTSSFRGGTTALRQDLTLPNLDCLLLNLNLVANHTALRYKDGRLQV